MDISEILSRAIGARVTDVIPSATPLERAERLSERIGHPVMLKREDLTPIHSFKLRGAYNKIARLDGAARSRGVVAASAGNHAQGVAFAAARLAIAATLVMPRTTPRIKVDAVRALGAAVELAGDDYSQAAAQARRIAAETGMTQIPAYDDLDVIAGQATIALELLRQAGDSLGTVFVPVGGGGLAAGIAAVIKSARPQCRVVGVEPEDSDAMTRSIAARNRVTLDHVGIFADGVAVRQVGAITFELCRTLLDGCITVSIDEICAAIRDVFEDTRAIVEPAGALAVAGLKRYAHDGNLGVGAAVAICSGANLGFDRLAFVAERAALGEYQEAMLAVTIPERPGAFAAFCREIGERAILEFNYRISSRDEAHIFVGLEARGREDAACLIARLEARGYRCLDLTASELAKSHIRHLIGGRANIARDEVFYSFEFPSRPGAILKFLERLDARWNISLFHYRNQGGAYGRVLCGFEAPRCDRVTLRARLAATGIDFREETGDPALAYFLGAQGEGAQSRGGTDTNRFPRA